MPRWKIYTLFFAFSTVNGLLLFLYKYLDFVARDRYWPWSTPLIEELTGSYTFALLLPLAIWFAHRVPVNRKSWMRSLPAHAAVAVLFGATHTTLMAISRAAIFPMLGLGPYDYGIMRVRYPMELAGQLIWYAIIVAFVNLFDRYRAAQARELETARLESRLAQAQLQNLRLQLQPHFLFNALNAISSVMYEDPRAADEMIARLCDLLRLTLRDSGAQEVPLAQELEYLDAYLRVMQARFEDRLAVRFQLEPGAEEALVPQLILQPLVENSIRHGADPQSAAIDIAVTAARANGSLHLAVRDRGPGLKESIPSALGRGIGLSNTADRLEKLYGAGQKLRIENPGDGGLLVSLEIPFHTA